MLGYWRSHEEYRDFVLRRLETFGGDFSPVHEHLRVILKLFILDLDPLKEVVAGCYSHTGRKAESQPETFRIFILMQDLGLTPKQCIDKLKHNRALRMACGLSRKEVPSVGSLYNFIGRVMGPETRPKVRRFLRKPAKKLKQGEKLPPKHPNITSKLKDEIVCGRRFADPAATTANAILKIAVKQSYSLGLLKPTINISGDGTCIPTGASHYGKKTCGCAGSGIYNCECPRKFSDPSAAWGWDSHESKFFYGYTGYFISTHDAAHKTDLPIYLRIVDAKRHDSVSALAALSECIDLYPQLSFGAFASDSASDNQATYELLDFWGVGAVIALGKANNGKAKYPAPLSIGGDGAPVCPSGNRMVFWGNSGKNRPRLKWRCPRVLGKSSAGNMCGSCSPSEYGRTVYTKPEWDLRLFCRIPRGSEQWKKIMNGRTASERVNDRILNDYGVGKSARRGKKRIFFFTLIAAVNIHLDAQLKVLMAEHGQSHTA